MTDCLGHLVGLKTRYLDIVNPPPPEKRTAEEIKAHICGKLAKIGGE